MALSNQQLNFLNDFQQLCKDTDALNDRWVDLQARYNLNQFAPTGTSPILNADLATNATYSYLTQDKIYAVAVTAAGDYLTNMAAKNSANTDWGRIVQAKG